MYFFGHLRDFVRSVVSSRKAQANKVSEADIELHERDAVVHLAVLSLPSAGLRAHKAGL